MILIDKYWLWLTIAAALFVVCIFIIIIRKGLSKIKNRLEYILLFLLCLLASGGIVYALGFFRWVADSSNIISEYDLKILATMGAGAFVIASVGGLFSWTWSKYKSKKDNKTGK